MVIFHSYVKLPEGIQYCKPEKVYKSSAKGVTGTTHATHVGPWKISTADGSSGAKNCRGSPICLMCSGGWRRTQAESCGEGEDLIRLGAQHCLIHLDSNMLDGGFKHFLFSISYMGCHPSHWLSYFWRWCCTTNQPCTEHFHWKETIFFPRHWWSLPRNWWLDDHIPNWPPSKRTIL